jgi:hypothetical protein
MKRTVNVVTAFALSLSIAACGTIIHGTSQDVGVSSSPTNAQVTVDKKPVGQTPVVAKLSRKDNHIVTLTTPGYAPAELTLTRGTSGWVWGNLVFGGLVGLAVDAISGGLYKLTPDQLAGTLARQGASIAPAKDGVYIVMVKTADPTWSKVGQLTRLSPAVGD